MNIYNAQPYADGGSVKEDSLGDLIRRTDPKTIRNNKMGDQVIDDARNGVYHPEIMQGLKGINPSRKSGDAMDYNASEIANDRTYGTHTPHLATGGITPPSWLMRSASRSNIVNSGLLHSPVAGRTDHLPIKVPDGSYVIPSDIVSSLGEGNTFAGSKLLQKMFHSGPGFTPLPGLGHGKSMMPRPSRPPGMKGGFAKGGNAEGTGEPVPIMAAGGEFIIHPDAVRRVGGGDLKRGHEILDHFILHTRKKNIKVLKKLPGPAHD